MEDWTSAVVVKLANRTRGLRRSLVGVEFPPLEVGLEGRGGGANKKTNIGQIVNLQSAVHKFETSTGF